MAETMIYDFRATETAGGPPIIPGISATELQLMRDAATCFLNRPEVDATARMAVEDLATLTQPAGRAAAGIRAPVRDWGYYKGQSGAHEIC